MNRWQRVFERSLQRTRIFELRSERFVSPRTQQAVDAVVAEALDWVNVVALTPDQQLVMVRQFRFGADEVTLEIPGGMVDPGEAPVQAAQRELREETGYQASRWTSLGFTSPNPAFIRNRLHCFLAEGCERVGDQQQDAGEHIEVELHPASAIEAMIASGQVQHALVEVAFLKLSLHRQGLPLVEPKRMRQRS